MKEHMIHAFPHEEAEARFLGLKFSDLSSTWRPAPEKGCLHVMSEGQAFPPMRAFPASRLFIRLFYFLDSSYDAKH